MATITSTPESIFFGSPLTVTVQPGVAPKGAAFHRVLLDVSVSGRRFPSLSRPADGAADFDISSCLKAVHERYNYTPVTSYGIMYPSYSVNLTATDVWVIDGKEATGGKSVYNISGLIAGHYSDYERASGIALTQTHSRKPQTGELVCVGDRIVFTESTGRTPSSSVYSVTVNANMGPLSIGGRTYFVIPPDRRSRQFQFVNSRGVVESIRAFALVAEKASMEKKETTYSIFERLRSMSRTYMRKAVKPSTFSLSSGFVNYEWAQWWAYEFCAADQHWMLHDGKWIPVHISVSDTTVIDRAKTDLLHVDFDVNPDLNGGLF